MAAKDELGRRGERIAEHHLIERGLVVLDRNWRCPSGEIDLVLRDGDETVFVEVKTRAGLGYGHPLEAITMVKLARLRRLAGEWCEHRRAAAMHNQFGGEHAAVGSHRDSFSIIWLK